MLLGDLPCCNGLCKEVTLTVVIKEGFSTKFVFSSWLLKSLVCATAVAYRLCDNANFLLGNTMTPTVLRGVIPSGAGVHPRTDATGEADIPPKFFADRGKTVGLRAAKFGMTIFYPFCTVCASGDLLPWKIRSPGQFELPDLASSCCNFETGSESK